MKVWLMIDKRPFKDVHEGKVLNGYSTSTAREDKEYFEQPIIKEMFEHYELVEVEINK